MLRVNGNLNAMPRKIDCKLTIGGNSITNVKMLTYASDWSGDITIGQCVSSYITATIPTPSFSLAGANVSHSMGINGEYVAIGQYRVDESSIRTRQGYTSFTAYDKLHDTVNTYHSSLAFPASLQSILNEVCLQIGIASTALNVSYTVDEDILSGYTLRDVLGFCAAMVGKNAYLSPSGGLELRWFSSVGYTADGTRANVPYIGESNCTVNRLICQTSDGVITSGSGQGIYFTCPLMTQDWLDWLQGNLSGLSYRKADVDIPYGNFCLQSGDIITVSTTGTNLSVPIMANSWTYDGGLSSSVSAYGVSDYSGTANNAERSVTAQRVQRVLDTKRAANREREQYRLVSEDIARATDIITGATGGYIKLDFGGNGKTAQLLVMDAPSYTESLNVWLFNQNGLGHIQRATTADAFGSVNVALTREGAVVAERIAGNKISGVRFESTSEGTGSQPQVIVEKGSYTINRAQDGNTSYVGSIKFQDRSSASDTDTLAIQVKYDNNVTIGTPDNPEFFYRSRPELVSGAEKFMFFGGNIKVFGDVKFGNGGNSSLSALVSRIEALEKRVAELESK